MGKDSPYQQASQLNDSETDDDEKFQIQNNPSNKDNDYQSIMDLCKDNSCTGSQGKDYEKLHDERKSWKGQYIQRNNQHYNSDETKPNPQDANEEKTQNTLLHDASCHSADNRDLDNDNGSDYKDKLVKHGSMDFCNSKHEDYYFWTLEQTEKTSNKIDTRAFQKQDYSQEFTKYMTSFLDKCSLCEKTEQETIDETTSLNEDDDTTAEELSTSDNSEGLEEIVKESYDPDCSDIGIVRTSEGSVDEANKDSSTDDECNSQAGEDCEDDVFPPLHIDEQQLQFADDPVMNIVVGNNWANQQAEPEIEQQADDAIIDIVVESSCDEEAVDDELSGIHSADEAPPKSTLLIPPFYYTPDVTTPVDVTAKHLVLSNNGYAAAGDTEGTMVIVNMNVQIPTPQDNLNPLLPVQPSSLDDSHAHQMPFSAGHPNVEGMDCSDGSDGIKQVEDISSHEQQLSPGCLNIQQMDYTNGSDSVEQAEDELMFNSQVSLIVDPPQVIEVPLVSSFSASSEGTVDSSDFPDTGSEDCEESDCWLPSPSGQDEYLNFT